RDVDLGECRHLWHTHTHTHTYTHTYTHTHTQKTELISNQRGTLAQRPPNTHILLQLDWTVWSGHTHTYTQPHTHTHIHTNTLTHKHTHTHTHRQTHTHTHTHRLPKRTLRLMRPLRPH